MRQEAAPDPRKGEGNCPDDLATFLDEWRLIQFLSEFQEAGINTLQDMERMTRHDIKRIAKYSEAFHEDIWAAVNALRVRRFGANHVFNARGQQADRSLVDFLQRTGYMQYHPVLTQAGINTLADLPSLTQSVARKIGILESHIPGLMNQVLQLSRRR